jgi:hypothetical protein
MSNKLYRGIRQGMIAQVYVDNDVLSLAKANHLRFSDATPEWGYSGDGPSQLSLAILLDATEDQVNALKYMHEFKAEFIAVAEYSVGFTILQSQIQQWLSTKIARDSNPPGKGWII